MSQFCAYVHARPNTADAYGIFYVGKGTKKRIREFRKSRNAHHQNIVDKYGVESLLTGSIDCSTEALAYELEKGLIKCLTRMGVKLANKSAGGEGTPGVSTPHREETKRKISATMKGVKKPEGFGAKQAARTDNRKGYRHTPEAIAKIREASILMPRKPHSEETKRKIGEKSRAFQERRRNAK